MKNQQILLMTTLLFSACSPSSSDDSRGVRNTMLTTPRVTATSSDQSEQLKGHSAMPFTDFLLPSDLDATYTIKKLTSEQMKEQIEQNGEEHFKPLRLSELIDNKNLPDNESKCILEELGKLPVLSQGGKTGISAEVDISECLMNELKEKTGLTNLQTFTTNAKLKVLHYFTCDTLDTSNLKDKTFAEMEDILEKENCASLSYLTHLKLNFSLTVKGSNGELHSNKDFVFAVNSPDGKPCSLTKTQDHFTNGECLFIDKKDSKITGMKKGINPSGGSYSASFADSSSDLMKLTFKGLTATDEQNKWYQGGQANVLWNNWNGNVNYRSADQTPLYNLANKEETINGEIKK